MLVVYFLVFELSGPNRHENGPHVQVELLPACFLDQIAANGFQPLLAEFLDYLFPGSFIKGEKERHGNESESHEGES